MDTDEDIECDDDILFEMDENTNFNHPRPPLPSSQHPPRVNRTPSKDPSEGNDFDDEEEDQDYDISLDGDSDDDMANDGRNRRTSQILPSSLNKNLLSNGERNSLGKPRVAESGSPCDDGAQSAIAVSGLEISYDVLSPEQICKYMSDVVKEVNQVVQLPATTVRLLLSQLHWDKESLMERFFEDTDKLFQAAHVASPTVKSQPVPVARSTSRDACDICFASLKGGELKGTDCGHRFCASCWQTYLTGKIMDENIAYKIECPAYDCHILVDDVFVMEMVESNAVRRKYQRAITNSFVESHRNMRWCPGTDCLYAVRVQSAEWMPVMCTRCSTIFCFVCGQPWHDPVTCTVLKRWQKKCADDSETSNWISANTKECPECHATIEKDGGCNHVVCKNLSCKSEFCWICLGPWKPHGASWFKCNRFVEEDSKAARSAQEQSRAALQRYLFYFNRFMNHQQSLRLETKLNNSIRQKMEEMQQHNMSWIEVQFLQKAVIALQQCRQTLMYTYVFAFYLLKNNQQIIFENNQHDLENATEDLSGLLERDITGQNATETKQKVQDKAGYCESRRRALIEHVHEGYEKDWWEFYP